MIIAAALFHAMDVGYARNILEGIEYAEEKIAAVEYAIVHCRDSKDFPHHTLESEILHNAILIEELIVA